MQNPCGVYSYARVSTDVQDVTSRLAQLKSAGAKSVPGEDHRHDRPRLRELTSALSIGDVVIIPSVDRLSRDTTDLLVIAREMQRAGAGIRSLAGPFLDTTFDFA